MHHVINSIGVLGVLHFSELPFTPQRIYWLSGTPVTQERGHHAHKLLEQFVICLSGSVEVDVHDGKSLVTTKLEENSDGLYIKSGSWRVLRNFRVGCTVLVIASREYEPSDYIHDFEEFLDWVGAG